MTKDEARAVLIEAFATLPDLPDDMKATLANLIMPPPPPAPKRRRWRRK